MINCALYEMLLIRQWFITSLMSSLYLTPLLEPLSNSYGNFVEYVIDGLGLECQSFITSLHFHPSITLNELYDFSPSKGSLSTKTLGYVFCSYYYGSHSILTTIYSSTTTRTLILASSAPFSNWCSSSNCLSNL